MFTLRLTGTDTMYWHGRRPDQASARSGQGSLREALAAVGEQSVAVLVPGSDCLLTEAQVPTRNRQRLQKAVPFALEDQLVSDIDALHFAIGPALAGQAVPVAVVDRVRMDDWLAQLQTAGLQPELLIPEVLALPYTAGAWTILLEDHQVLVRSGAYLGYAAEPEMLTTLLASALLDTSVARPTQIAVYGSAGADLKALAAEHEIALIEQPCHDVMALFAAQLNTVNTINLLQGGYSRNEQLQRLWRPWRLTAALAAVWLVVLIGGRMVEYHQLDNQHEALKQEILALYKQTFPQDRSVRDPRIQMERHLAKLRGGDSTSAGLLELLAKSGPALKATETLELKALRSQGGELELELSIADLQALDDLKQRLTGSAALSVDIVSATARDGKVEGRIKIRSKS